MGSGGQLKLIKEPRAKFWSWMNTRDSSPSLLEHLSSFLLKFQPAPRTAILCPYPTDMSETQPFATSLKKVIPHKLIFLYWITNQKLQNQRPQNRVSKFPDDRTGGEIELGTHSCHYTPKQVAGALPGFSRRGGRISPTRGPNKKMLFVHTVW